MKKISLISTFATLCILCANMQAIASTDVEFKTVIKTDGEYFSVKGTTPSGDVGKYINIFITNPNKTLQSADGALNSFVALKTGANGSFEYEVPVYMDGADDTGDYSLYISGTDYQNVYTHSEKLFLASAIDKKNAVLLLKGSDLSNIHTNLTTVVSPYTVTAEKTLSLTNEIYNAVSKTELEKLIVANKTALNENNVTDAVFFIKQLALVQAANEGKTSFFVDTAGAEINKDIIDLSSADSGGVTLYNNVYKNAIAKTDENGVTIPGKDGVLAYIKNTNPQTITEFLNEFKKGCMIYGMNNPTSGGGSYFETLLTAENAQATGVVLGTYTSVDQNVRNVVNSKLEQMSFTDISDISTKLGRAITDATLVPSPVVNPGGIVGGGNFVKPTGVTTPITLTGEQPEAFTEVDKKELFIDIENYAWANEAITALYNKGVVTGIGDNKYNPEGEIKREDFVVMLSRAFSIKSDSEIECFSDCDEEEYYHNALNAVKALEIVKGINSNEFGVGLNITRQDLCVMLYNTMKHYNLITEINTEMTFEDKSQIKDYAVKAVEYFSAKGIVSGFPDNTFRPEENCTRAQAAKIIYGVLEEAK